MSPVIVARHCSTDDRVGGVRVCPGRCGGARGGGGCVCARGVHPCMAILVYCTVLPPVILGCCAMLPPCFSTPKPTRLCFSPHSRPIGYFQSPGIGFHVYFGDFPLYLGVFYCKKIAIRSNCKFSLPLNPPPPPPQPYFWVSAPHHIYGSVPPPPPHPWSLCWWMPTPQDQYPIVTDSSDVKYSPESPVRGGGGEETYFYELLMALINGTKIGLESFLEHFIFLNFLGGGFLNPPQGEVATQKFSHHKISNPRFTNPIYTHAVTV